jgi:hypothetical protein
VWNEFCRPVRVLRQPLLLAYLAVHASSHFYSIMQIRLVELILVARKDFAGRPDLWRALDELVERTGTGRFVFPALDLAERLVPGTIDPLLLEHVTAAASGGCAACNTTGLGATPASPFSGLRSDSSRRLCKGSAGCAQWLVLRWSREPVESKCRAVNWIAARLLH